MLTDQDLPRALHDFADRNAPDAAAVRAAIEHGIASKRSAGRGGAAERGGLVLQARRRGRPLALFAVAAGTLVLVGLGLVVTQQRQTAAPGPGTSSRASSLLPLPGIGSFPGSRLLGAFAGTGPQTVALPRYSVPRNFRLTANVDCRGAGGVKVYTDSSGSWVGQPSCALGSTAGSAFPAGQRSLRVAVSPTTQWRVAVAVEPDPRTNGSVQSPPSTALAKPLASGRGTQSVMAPAQFGDQAMVELTCVGTGVSLTSANHRFDGQYTHTCFAGHSYTFRISRPGLPTTVTVHADATTTWRLALLD